MVKKIIAIVMTVALLGTFFVMPASASEEGNLSDTMFFSVDYRTGSANERVGGGEPTYTQVETAVDPKDKNNTETAVPTQMTYAQDAELNASVAYFGGNYSVGYEVDHTKLEKEFTVEIYFKIGSGQSRWGMLCGTLWMQGDTAVHGFALTHTGMKLNGITDETLKTDTNNPAYVGPHRKYLCGWSIGNGVQGCSNISFPGDGKAATMRENKDKWIHMVYTHDGENECLYVDGVKLVEREAAIKEVVHDTSNEMAALFRIGGYNWANNWDMDDAYVACVNLYDTAATADEVTALYTNRADAAPITGATPDPDATPKPTADPNATAEPTNAPATAKPTEAPKPDNAQTFDLGLVSLAAVALSSAVVVKKKRK